MSPSFRGSRLGWTAIAAAAALTLAACGDSASGGGSGDPVKIGVAVPLSGPTASNNVQLSAELAAKHINEAGGVNGRTIELVVEDNGATAATGLTAARKFVQADVDAVVGYSLTTQNLAVSPVFKTAKVINLTGTASTANNVEQTDNPYTFIMNIPDDETADHQVTFALQELKAKRFGLLLDSTAFGETYGKLVTPLIEAGGGSVVVSESVNPDANDLSAQVGKVVGADVDVVLVALLTPPTVTLMYNELTKQGAQELPLIAAAATVATFGKSVPWKTAEGTYATYMTDGMYDPTALSATSKVWFDDQKERGQSPPTDSYAEAYDSFLALAAAIEATGGTDPDKLVDYFKNLKDFSGWKNLKTVSGPYTCAPTHQCLHTQFMGQVQGEGIKKVVQY